MWLCTDDREADRLSERSSGNVFLPSATDRPSLLSSLFHRPSPEMEPDASHRLIGQKLADSVPPRSTSPVAGEKSHSLPIERMQLTEVSRPLSANVTSHMFSSPAVLQHRVSTTFRPTRTVS